MEKKKGIGFSYAWYGLKHIILHEKNFRIHLFAAFIVVVLGVFLKITLMEWAIILLTIGFVWLAEMINTVIEEILDFIEPNDHPKIKIMKYMMAAAVLK